MIENHVLMLPKGLGLSLSRNLQQIEVDCKCQGPDCHFTLVDSKLIILFQQLRNEWKSGIKINSGYRCQSHNKLVGGTVKSKHTMGQALDLVPVNGNLEDFEKIASVIFPKTIKYGSFIHCDTRSL